MEQSSTEQQSPEHVDETPERLTVSEAAQLFGVSDRTLRKRIAKGDLEQVQEMRYGRDVYTVAYDDVAKFWPMKGSRKPRATRDMGREGGPDESGPQGVPQEKHLAVVAERDQLRGRVDLLGEQLQAEQKQAATLTLELGRAQEQVAQLGDGGANLPAPVRRKQRAATAVLSVVTLAAVGGAWWFGEVRSKAAHAQDLAAESTRTAERATEAAGLREQMVEVKSEAQAAVIESGRRELEAAKAKGEAELELARTVDERDRIAKELEDTRRARVLGWAQWRLAKRLLGVD